MNVILNALSSLAVANPQGGPQLILGAKKQVAGTLDIDTASPDELISYAITLSPQPQEAGVQKVISVSQRCNVEYLDTQASSAIQDLLSIKVHGKKRAISQKGIGKALKGDPIKEFISPTSLKSLGSDIIANRTPEVIDTEPLNTALGKGYVALHQLLQHVWQVCCITDRNDILGEIANFYKEHPSTDHRNISNHFSDGIRIILKALQDTNIEQCVDTEAITGITSLLAIQDKVLHHFASLINTPKNRQSEELTASLVFLYEQLGSLDFNIESWNRNSLSLFYGEDISSTVFNEMKRGGFIDFIANFQIGNISFAHTLPEGDNSQLRRLLIAVFINSPLVRNDWNSLDGSLLIHAIITRQRKRSITSEEGIQITSFLSQTRESLDTGYNEFLCNVILGGAESIPYIAELDVHEREFFCRVIVENVLVTCYDIGFLTQVSHRDFTILSSLSDEDKKTIQRASEHPETACCIISIEDKYQQLQYIHASYPGREEMSSLIDAGREYTANVGEISQEIDYLWYRGGFGEVVDFNRPLFSELGHQYIGILDNLYSYFGGLEEERKRSFITEYFSLDLIEQGKTFGVLQRLESQDLYRSIPSLAVLRACIEENIAWGDEREIILMYLEEEDFGSSEGYDSILLAQGEEGIGEAIDEPTIPEQLIVIFGEDITEVIEYYDFSDRSCISLLCFKDLGKSFIDDFVTSLQNPPAESFFSENKEEDIIAKFFYISSLLKLFEKNHIFSVERNDKLFEFCFKRGEEFDMEIIEEYLCQIHTSTRDHESYIAPVMRFLKTGSILYLKNDSKLTIGSISDASKYAGEENQKKVMSQLQTFLRGVSSAFDALETGQEYSYLIEGLHAQEGESYIDYIQRIVSLEGGTIASMLTGNDTHGFTEFFQTKLNGAGTISCIEYIEIIRDWISERDDIPMVDFDQSYNDLQTQLREGLQDIPEDRKIVEPEKKKRNPGPARQKMSENSYISELSPMQHGMLRRISSARSNNIDAVINSVFSSALHATYPEHRMVYYKLLYSALKTGHCWTPEQKESFSTLIAGSEGSLSTKAIANAAYGLQSFQSTEIPQSLLHSITSDVNKQYKAFTKQGLSMTLMGLSDSKHIPEVQATSSKLFGEVKERGTKELDDLDIRYIIAAYHLHDRKDEIPSAFTSEYERIKGLPHKARIKERECFQIVKQKFGDAINGVHIDGFELDIQLLSGLLNIEIDGDHHEDQKHYDEKRDLYLKNTHSIITRRYVLCQPTLKEELRNFNVWLDKTLGEIQESGSNKK